ncbi:hypothetical protein M5689_017007 [Euphorbia peplus]|nr:hypothetical protein M5689_017007 [Euphorbia peplus]
MFGPSFDKKGKTNTNEFGLRARDRQESIDFDNWEFPSSCATEEDVNERNQLEELVHDHQHNDHEQHNDQEESWQIVFSKSSNYNPSNKELKQFDEVLRYWKTKERGQM